MSDISIRKVGRAGRITLTRPKALNALTYEMMMAINAALGDWADDPEVALVVIDAEGDRAFCSGGDIAEMYATGTKGDFAYGRKFWRDEYRMNARLFEFPKPVVSLMQGFTMGGGVGVGCHGSHRIVGESSKIAMPECTIGLIPDVGGSLILARAPGRLGEYLGVTGDRMDAADAIHAGFADYFVPEAKWPALIAELEAAGDWEAVDRADEAPAPSRLASIQADIDAVFGGETLGDMTRGLPDPLPEAITHAIKLMDRNSPLAMACAIEIIRRVRTREQMRFALDLEYRFTYRSMEHGDFIEGIRAAIIDKDRNPKWRHDDWRTVPGGDILKMTLPLGADALTFERDEP
jgi:enoyl-CoA hydratase